MAKSLFLVPIWTILAIFGPKYFFRKSVDVTFLGSFEANLDEKKSDKLWCEVDGQGWFHKVHPVGPKTMMAMMMSLIARFNHENHYYIITKMHECSDYQPWI